MKFILHALLVPFTIGSGFAFSGAQTQGKLSVPTVNFCRLIQNHAQFHNRVIRVKAILVENQTPRVDGGDPILYDVACADSDFSVVVLFSDSFKSSAAYAALRRINEKPNEAGNTRAVVTLLGKFEASGKREYGHLDWADSQFVIYKIEKTSPVDPSAIWPKKFRMRSRAKSLDRSIR